MGVPDRPSPPGGGPPRFTERLSVPWWWWPLGGGVAVLLAAEVHLGYPGVRAWLPYVLLAPLTVAALWWLGRHRVEVGDDQLRVGPATLPLRHVGRVSAVAARDKRAALGPGLDPAAYVLHRPWVGPALRVDLTDPADPTPYWLFSVRDPAGLAAVLLQEQTQNGRHPEGGRPS